MKRLVLLFVFVFTILSADEINWSDISHLYSFPSGVKLYKGTRVSPILECYYLDVDLNDSNIAIRPYITSNSKNVKLFAQDVDCIAAINGGYFGSGIPYSTVLTPENLDASNVPAVTRNAQSYPVIRSMFSLNTSFKPSIDWIYHFGTLREGIYRFDEPLDYAFNDPLPRPIPLKSEGYAMDSLLIAIGGGPILVKDSALHITYNEELMWGSGVGLDNRDPRTAIGYTRDHHVLIMVADGRQTHSGGMSLSDIATVLLDKGCVQAINLDGGGSTQMVIPGDYINNPSEERAVPAILAITYRDSCRIPTESAFNIILDTEDSRYVSRTGSWFPSANSGYWGDTKALLSGKGDGTAICRFYTALEQATYCDVYGWWVADPNRSNDTPYVIIHEEGCDTVRVNQQLHHAQWNYLGNYRFNSSPEMAIIVSNLTSNGNYVVADAVKLCADTPLTIAQPTAVSHKTESNISLLSVFPNPFNPLTNISYMLEKQCDVKIQIYDINGNMIKTITNGIQDAGQYQLTYNATGLSSGVYMFSLTYDGNQMNKKITYLK